MYKKTICLLLLLAPVIGFTQVSSFYDIAVGSAAGSNIDFNKYKGKLILIVNTASGNSRAETEMQQLQVLARLYKDSGLVVMIFPSNSFGNEPKSNSELQSAYGQDLLKITGQKSIVTGAGMSLLYEWLTQQAKNGVVSVPVKGDFQKYLIGRKGVLVGYFSGRLFPTDITVLKAISANLHP